MANQALGNIFQDLHSKMATSVSPDSVMDDLFSKKVIGSDDYYRLRQVPVSRDRCRDLLSLLYVSSHPQVFIYLRLALLDEYSWLVDEIDKKVPSLTSQLQQLQLDNLCDGEHCCHQSRICIFFLILSTLIVYVLQLYYLVKCWFLIAIVV